MLELYLVNGHIQPLKFDFKAIKQLQKLFKINQSVLFWVDWSHMRLTGYIFPQKKRAF